MSTQGFTRQDHESMARAIRLAWKGLYTTDPNPRVGCVLVRDGEIVGEGWHRKAGEPHAERIALAAAGEKARGATAYVTLEPCCHQGRTPPCTLGLIDAGVKRVIAAMEDPNPLVSGKGLQQLREAGIETASGLLRGEAQKLNPGFIKRMSKGLPWVRCKLAMSLDGRTAMASGESVWITGEDARRDVQRLRARSSVLVTGIGTVLADDPALNVRLSPEQLPGVESGEYLRQPVRVVLDSSLRTPETAKLFTLPGEVWLFHAHGSPEKAAKLEAKGARLLRLEQGLDLPLVMQELAHREINEVLIEAGPTLAGAALQSGVIDELVIYMAPHVMGHQARGLFHLPGLEKMAERVPLEITDIRAVGRDWRITAHPAG
ncbi:MAG: bifunctional diaminohydroxyphosphoribosylaminopyrimidine deaminase/5-amino-6-(5-phosphoribosylamino)uracil reductase RibD [Gammaproteobacteria bacterium]|nr:MAG: bifunctional diaminohydroxyphosphoribosylaminopyrimidine deaminase/5-amino-6-(5-phosphoribosylamino)uracil reductase RibD [Gammaproteobacteria bacterium]RTZ76185.1 MAG: bifunctional diaminohydroxyphosphoribosylaminopyrimidine deaminase/5-amino-6-(5-phosphoribosylamino)uracil reductase RibD [Gammaproteobacteria bacterium]RTZ81064.1 MAG: bifunctional diaminohydroxyphosphoribosylaminopyrimidine deaminase/5-amino-6-(5-phosphoribosylamino)uracil reductase RibD [Gammaproteobacteria bacterium]